MINKTEKLITFLEEEYSEDAPKLRSCVYKDTGFQSYSGILTELFELIIENKLDIVQYDHLRIIKMLTAAYEELGSEFPVGDCRYEDLVDKTITLDWFNKDNRNNKCIWLKGSTFENCRIYTLEKGHIGLDPINNVGAEELIRKLYWLLDVNNSVNI